MRSAAVLRLAIVLAGFAVIGGQAAGEAAARQRPPAGRPAPGESLAVQDAGQGEALPLREVQRWFDAYVSMQAKDALGLNDGQVPPFLARLAALQDARRRDLLARQQALQQLNRLTGRTGGPIDESRVRDLLRTLNDLEERALANQRRAYEAVDQLLDLRQQARFRIFEEQMERRKLEMLARARRGAALRRQPVR